ncbi:single-stranded-DNA-specific exonuclease RecJ [Jeotgalibaca sp. A122]|uniref:single-stranded-DNA-specific exonuclease RecJ n=1 Tax=Jeotgalibaca sp. A122 TaxID=3457322 RepID=UPI003FD18BF6
MLNARLNWNLKEKPFDESPLSALRQQTTYSGAFLKLCIQRGLDTEEKLNAFLNPTDKVFHDPFLMHDMEKAVNRIRRAIEKGETIVVYGDYDADGITSTTILVEAIEVLGGNVSFYLPNRFKDGYGPNTTVFQKLVEEGTELIITCDNGVSGHEAIEIAMKADVDVIITDHHELPEKLPNAYCVIHPRHPEGNYPFADLSGAGVALKVIAALFERVPYEFMDVAAIGTVSDLVSLTDENRWIVLQGIQALKNTERIGLHLLFEKAGVSVDSVDEDTIGFVIGPRLNALGRLGDASPGVELLMSFDEDQLMSLVETIQQTNAKRQEIVSTIYESAVQKVAQWESLPDVIVLYDENWHEGVLGIVASRIVEQTGRPTILLHFDKATGIAKGSGRSIEALHLIEALSHCAADLLKFGGHKMAAGMSLSTDKIPDFSESINKYAQTFHAEILKGDSIQVDDILELGDVTLDFLKEVNLLRPFGTDNPKPVFGFDRIPAANVKQIGTDQKHLKLMLQSGSDSLDVIGFNKGGLAEHLDGQPAISAIGELSINTWRDISKPQLQLKDVKVDTVQYFDFRQSKFDTKSLSHMNSVYLFFNNKFFEKMSEHLPTESVAVLLESDDIIPDFSEDLTNLVILDCPTDLDNVETFLKNHPFNNYYIYAYPVDLIQIQGMPTKEVFARVYKYLYSKKDIAIKEKLDELSAFLKIDKNLLVFVIQVFLEAKFVTIDYGVLNPVPSPPKQVLMETEVYKKRYKKIQSEKMFIYSSFADLSIWLKK